jgi:hypothetical protein
MNEDSMTFNPISRRLSWVLRVRSSLNWLKSLERKRPPYQHMLMQCMAALTMNFGALPGNAGAKPAEQAGTPFITTSEIVCEVEHYVPIRGESSVPLIASYRIELSSKRIELLSRSQTIEQPAPSNRYPAQLCSLDYYPKYTYNNALESTKNSKGDYVIKTKGKNARLILILKKKSESQYLLQPMNMQIISEEEERLSDCQSELALSRSPAIRFSHNSPVEFDFSAKTCKTILGNSK